MRNSEQREFLQNLRRPQINQLCLEMQTIISNLKLFLAETYGITEQETSKIMQGKKVEEIESLRNNPSAGVPNLDEPESFIGTEESTHEDQKSEEPIDLSKLKNEDEAIRRSLMFELEWCVAQVQQGNYPA